MLAIVYNKMYYMLFYYTGVLTMPRTAKTHTALAVTPSEVLQKFIDDYQTNAFALSKSLNVAYQSVT